jgi:uroporphyrinogen-III synthase
MLPLEGQRIVVTRAAHQAEELAAPLRALGAMVIPLPSIGIGPPADLSPLREAAARCNEYDWIIFSSTNAVEAYVAQIPAGTECKARVAAVGAATRVAAERAGLSVVITPREFVAESLVKAFAEEQIRGMHVLIPRAAVTRDVISSALAARGAEVTAVEAYRNVVPEALANDAGRVFRAPLPDWVLFASSSACENLVRVVPPEMLGQVRIGSIGPITSKSVERAGLRVAAEATVHSVDGLVSAVVQASVTG